MSESEGTVADGVCNDDEDISRDHHGTNGLDSEAEPLAEVQAAQRAGNHSARRPQGVGQAVAQLVGKNHNLLVDTQHLAQGAEDGHHHDCLAGTGDHEEVQGRDEDVDDEQGDHGALAWRALPM